MLQQLASLYRDAALIRKAVDQAAARQQAGRPQLEERRRALAEEIRRTERALDRYYAGFEASDLDAGRFQTRVSAPPGAARNPLRARPSPRPRARRRSRHSARHGRTAAVADRLERTIAEADPKQAKALLRLLIKDLRVHGRSEIVLTYRIVTSEVCALPSSVGAAGIEPATSRV